MKILFVSNPAHGQANPLLSIAHELLARGHEVHVCSADRLIPRIRKLASAVGDHIGVTVNGKGSETSQLHFHGVGDGLSVEDLTPYAHAHPEVFHSRARHKAGDLASYVNLVCEITSPGDEEYKQTVFKVRDVVDATRAEIVVVDNFSPFAMDGVRLSGAHFIQTSPGAACAVARAPSPFQYPLPLSGASGDPSSRHGVRMIWRNLRFAIWFVRWCSIHPFPKARRLFRYEQLGLKPVDYVCDSFMTPVPGMVDEMAAALSFNVAGLDLYGPEVYDKQVFFVGPCFAPPESTTGKGIIAEERDDVQAWLDVAQANGEEVVYINFGSIFYWTTEEFQALLDALADLRKQKPSLKAIIKVPNLPQDIQPLPPAASLPNYVLSSTWIPSITNVLSHPAVKVAMHHGGGNSFNEAVYYGLPQLIVSQWGETHDVASYGVAHGISKSVASAPKIVKDEVRTALEDIFANYEGYKANAIRWKLRCRQAGGTQAAADIVEAYAAEAEADVNRCSTSRKSVD